MTAWSITRSELTERRRLACADRDRRGFVIGSELKHALQRFKTAGRNAWQQSSCCDKVLSSPSHRFSGEKQDFLAAFGTTIAPQPKSQLPLSQAP